MMGKTEQVKLADLTPHPRNVRQGDVGAISESLQHHGQYRPIVAQKSTGHILAGNHTYKAAKALKWKTIETTWVDCDDDQALRILLMDNRANDIATYNDHALTDLLKALMDTEQQLAGTGFDPDDLDQLLKDLDAEQLPTITGDPDNIPEQVPAKTVPGDVWLLGKHRLMCGDSTNPTDLERLMAGKQADLLITDPPYGVSYAAKNETLNKLDGGNRITTNIENDHKTPDEMSQLWVATFSNARPHMRKGASYYVTGPQGGDLLLLLLQALKDSEYPLRHMLIWAKNNHVLGRSDYHYKHEPIIYGWVEGSHTWYGDHSQTSLWEINKPTKSDLHPTMKPVELYERAINNSTQRGEIVLDLFAGSGTVFVAAHTTNRVAYGMEFDPHYCDVICTRYQTLTGEQPIAEATGNPHNFLQ